LTAVIRSDLNLNAHADATIKELGKELHCPFWGSFGNFLLIALNFALLAAYIPSFSSILCSLCGNTVTPTAMICYASSGIALLFLLASDLIVHVNKFFFIALFSTLLLLIVFLLVRTPIAFVPQCVAHITLNDWTCLVPIVFTSFGLQGSIHSMTKFCQNDRELIKNACFWGSLIPAIVYIVWTLAVLLIVANTDAEFFQRMLVDTNIDVGALVTVLSKAAASKNIQIIVWFVSLFALLTSILGVGLALLDIFQRREHFSKWLAVASIVFLPALVAAFVPNAFIKILNLAGIILATLAIIVPVILAFKMQARGHLKCELLLKNKLVLFGVFVCGVAIITLGILEQVG
ncbi:MAG: hypothetical protein K2L24_01205, partial [Opitutales bacterium]|nr:hypothetical protein [Opitutales bacterium]